jgi:uncharacterized membrane protein YgcG
MLCVRTLIVFAVASLFASANPAMAQNLQITYGSLGVQTLSYQGVMLEDLSKNASDAFHIWHMKMTDLSGNLATCSQCGWGETNNGRAWNAATQTWTYSFSWGSISVQFQQSGNTLNMNVTETNQANSGLILDGASIYPFVLNFPQLPAEFLNVSYPQLAYETTGPGVTTADWGTGEVVAVDPNAAKPLYSGFQPTGTGFAYTPFISSTTPDGLAAFLPHNDRPVQPGQTDTFTVSLRFAPSGTATGNLATDAYQNWAQTWPMQLNWTDRRVIGYVALASSPQSGNVNQPGGFPNNPRRYFNDSNPNDFDVTTPAGLAKFQARILAQAASNVTNLQQLNAQGAITWDIEGEQYPQSTSYVCSPDQIAQVAPEMESVITDTASPFLGMKLDDAYFKTMTNAGFRVGVCIRPQQFMLSQDGTAQQVYLPDSAVEAELQHKMQYAHDRWGVTLFYVDSTVESDGAVLDAGIFQQVAAALPDSLIMPEESTPKHYAYTAPFLSFIFHGATGTDPTIYNYYPKAFSAILVNDVAASTLAAAQQQLTTSVHNGDVLMTHADYWQANNPTIVQIYQNAGVSSPPPPPPPPPSPTGPVSITSPAGGSTVSGAITVMGQVSVLLDAAGSYLAVDGTEWGTHRTTQAPFNYPLDTTMLTNGQHTLAIWAHDTSNTTDLSSPVIVTVANPAGSGSGSGSGTGSGGNGSGTGSGGSSPPPTPTGLVTITSPSSNATLAGTVSVSAQMTVNLDAAGSYLMVDGTEIGTSRVTQPPYTYSLDTTLLSNGQHTLQIWAHDTNNMADLSATVPVTVANTGGSSGGGGTGGSGSSGGGTTLTYPITLTYPGNGQGVSGTVLVTAMITQQLDSAASYLMVDGTQVGSRVGATPYVYPLNTAVLTPGQHVLQVWAHDTNNDSLLSNPVTVVVAMQ